MKAKESLKWFGILLLVFLLGISCMTMTALASGGIDPGQEGVLNLYFGENGTGFSEVAFSIYRVASVSEEGWGSHALNERARGSDARKGTSTPLTAAMIN